MRWMPLGMLATGHSCALLKLFNLKIFHLVETAAREY